MSVDDYDSTRGAVIGKSLVSGKGLFAKQKCSPGDLIFLLPRPLIGVLDATRLEDTCSNCFLWKESPLVNNKAGNSAEAIKFEVKACVGCKVLRYCGKQCQKESWKRHHRAECAYWGKLIQNTPLHRLPNAVRATIQILSMKQLKTINEDTWSSLMNLETHLEDFRKVGGSRWDDVAVFSQGVLSYSGTTLPYSQDIILHLFTKVLTNSLTIVTPFFDPLGICLDPFAATANHSCDPNAVVVMDGPILSFRALKSIQQGEEIFISYIDTTNPFPRRQTELKDRFYFTCTCSKCLHGPNLREDHFLPAIDKLDRTWINNAGSMKALGLQDFPEDPANYVGNDPVSRHLAVIQGSLFSELEEARKELNIMEATRRIKAAMRVCNCTNIFPITRQPYAALHQEYFANNLTIGQFTSAWIEGVNIYFEIDPVLYPQSHHPIRVVHTWGLAMLTSHLLEETGNKHMEILMNQGLDLPLFMCGLMLDIHKDLRKSHGKNSRFYKVADCMTNDMVGQYSVHNGEIRQDKILAQMEMLRRITK